MPITDRSTTDTQSARRGRERHFNTKDTKSTKDTKGDGKRKTERGQERSDGRGGERRRWHLASLRSYPWAFPSFLLCRTFVIFVLFVSFVLTVVPAPVDLRAPSVSPWWICPW